MSDSEGEKGYGEMISASNRKRKKAGGWQALGLDDTVYRAISKKGYRAPSPIQRKAIPTILDGKDVVAMARTGSGKTAAFLVPLFQKLKRRSAKSGARALLISPTRELALQTFKFSKELGKYTGLRAAVVVGGDSMGQQFGAIHENPDIIIATPGRLMHIVLEMNLKLNSVEYVVFDEADRLFEMGFADQLKDVLKRLPENRQTVLFSATLPKTLVDFARAGLTDPVLVRLDVDTKISEKLQMNFLACRPDDKINALLYLLRNVLNIENGEQTIIFCATKHYVEYLRETLETDNFICSYLYSSLDPLARKINISKFRHRQSHILIVTDVAARGVDIPLLDNVVNMHFPPKPKLFVHRVGRVARAGRTGRAFSLVSPDENSYLVDLFLFLGRTLKFATKTPSCSVNDASCSDLIGLIPQYVIDSETEVLKSLHEKSYELTQLCQVSQNSLKHYVKSRPPASGESIKRLKRDLRPSFDCIGPHPLFAETGEVEKERTEVLEGLKNYKPTLTVFEINASNKDEQYNTMKAKRKAHQKYVGQKPKSTANDHYDVTSDLTTKETAQDEYVKAVFSEVIEPKFHQVSQTKKRKVSRKQDEYFVAYRPTDFHSEQGLAVEKSFDHQAQQLVLDFTGDDNNDRTNEKLRNRKKWDRKKKKFIGVDGAKERRVKTEDGTWVPASYKSGQYEKWRKKQRLEATSRHEGSDDERPSGGLAARIPKRKHSRSELKSKEQILKERKKKAKVQSYQKYRKDTNFNRKSKFGKNK